MGWLSDLFSGTKAALAPRFQEHSYYTDFTSELTEHRWSIHYRGLISIQIDPQGIIHILGYSQYVPNCGNLFPDIKLEGNATFRVSNCANVTVEEGVSAEVHNCSLVRTRRKCKIDVYNCDTAETWDAGKGCIVPHGGTTVTEYTSPESQRPLS